MRDHIFVLFQRSSSRIALSAASITSWSEWRYAISALIRRLVSPKPPFARIFTSMFQFCASRWFACSSWLKCKSEIIFFSAAIVMYFPFLFWRDRTIHYKAVSNHNNLFQRFTFLITTPVVIANSTKDDHLSWWFFLALVWFSHNRFFDQQPFLTSTNFLSD